MAKILLVEDDKSLREIYGVRLQAEGYTITSAGDGEEALAVAIKERPDLIVSDVMMPKISGFDMLDILRSTTETKDIKVIMMTALSSEDQRARGEALGADRYLVKSQVGIEDVVRTVHDVLGDSITAAAPVTELPTPEVPAPVAMAPIPMPVAAPVPAPIEAPLPPAPVIVMPTPIVEPVAPSPIEAPIEVPAFQPLPQPVAAPIAFEAPATPAVAPIEPIVAMPVVPVAPVAPVMAEPNVAPFVAVPVPNPPAAPIAPIEPTPVPTPVFPAPSPVIFPPSVTLPQPTAPFSSDPPASLGDRIINPLPSADSLASGSVADIATQMNQELNAHLQGLEQPVTPTAVAPPPAVYAAPPQPPVPPMSPLPPQPGL